ncbi:MAG: hypothetical protein KQA41_04775 [Candidatus Aenigmarchaeota archaeon]|nr:hypothetical protein [Candidatus Aenigmarchaeota archaeon]
MNLEQRKKIDPRWYTLEEIAREQVKNREEGIEAIYKLVAAAVTVAGGVLVLYLLNPSIAERIYRGLQQALYSLR